MFVIINKNSNEKTLLLLFLSTFCIINVFAQNPVIVSGRVIDEKDKTDIPFATVQAFVKETGTLVTGAVTDENGRFNISGLQKRTVYSKLLFYRL